MSCDGYVIILLLLFGCHVNILVYEWTLFLLYFFGGGAGGGGVISRPLNFVCRSFGTLCSIIIRGVSRKINGHEMLSTYILYAVETECSETSAYKIQTPGITQKEEYNIQNTAKV
jgi:hypothetical protein